MPPNHHPSPWEALLALTTDDMKTAPVLPLCWRTRLLHPLYPYNKYVPMLLCVCVRTYVCLHVCMCVCVCVCVFMCVCIRTYVTEPAKISHVNTEKSPIFSIFALS